VEQACCRVLELKARLGLHRRPRIMPEAEARKFLHTGMYAADAEHLAEKSITLIRDRKNIVPLILRPGLRIGSVLITNRPEFNLDVFEGTLRAAGCVVTTLKNPADPEELYDRVESHEFDVLLVGFYYPPQWGWATGRAHGPEVRCLMSGFPIAHPSVPAAYFSWANPYHLYEFAFMDPYINTYGGAAGTQRAAARALLGQIPIVGRSPIELPGFFKVGDGLRRTRRQAVVTP